MHYLRTTVSVYFANREDNESVSCGSKRAILGRREGKRTYGDVGSVERRSKSICGRVRSSAFECDDGADLAYLGLCGCCTDEIEGGQSCSCCDAEKLHCGRMYETSAIRFFGACYVTFVRELGVFEDEGKRGTKLTLYISTDNHKSGINIEEHGSARSPQDFQLPQPMWLTHGSSRAFMTNFREAGVHHSLVYFCAHFANMAGLLTRLGLLTASFSISDLFH